MKELTLYEFVVSFILMSIIFCIESISLITFNTCFWAQFFILFLTLTKLSGLWYYRNKGVKKVTFLRMLITLYSFCINTAILIFIITLTLTISTFFLKISYIIVYSLTVQLIYFKELGVSNT